MWVDKPLAHYQIVDLEDIVCLLKYGVETVGKLFKFLPYLADILGP